MTFENKKKHWLLPLFVGIHGVHQKTACGQEAYPNTRDYFIRLALTSKDITCELCKKNVEVRNLGRRVNSKHLYNPQPIKEKYSKKIEGFFDRDKTQLIQFATDEVENININKPLIQSFISLMLARQEALETEKALAQY